MKAPGRFVNGLHVRQIGERGPVVVFESGLGASCLGWSAVQHRLEASARTFSYDRRGLGWSRELGGRVFRARPVPVSLRQITDDLRQLTSALNLNGPFVLVGHSLGALIARAYAGRFPTDISALVLIDPPLPSEWRSPDQAARRRLRRAVFYSRAAQVAASLGLARLGLWGLLRRGHGDAGPLLGLSETMRRVAAEVAKLPPEAAIAVRHFWSRPDFYRTLATYLRALPSLADEAAACAVPAELPVTVLSGSHQSAGALAEHRALATRRHVVVNGSAHWIHLDRPELVEEAIRELI